MRIFYWETDFSLTNHAKHTIVEYGAYCWKQNLCRLKNGLKDGIKNVQYKKSGPQRKAPAPQPFPGAKKKFFNVKLGNIKSNKRITFLNDDD